MYKLESLVTKCVTNYIPEPARIRSDRVKAPGLSLLFPLINSLLNLGWTIGKHVKSYLKNKRKHILVLQSYWLTCETIIVKLDLSPHHKVNISEYATKVHAGSVTLRNRYLHLFSKQHYHPIWNYVVFWKIPKATSLLGKKTDMSLRCVV